VVSRENCQVKQAGLILFRQITVGKLEHCLSFTAQYLLGNQVLMQLVQFLIAPVGISIKSVREDLHAEFMWMATVQDVMEDLRVVAVISIVHPLLCKLEHNIMVEANERTGYWLPRWIAKFFGLLAILCGHNHCAPGSTA
jgi:hypothetical protein